MSMKKYFRNLLLFVLFTCCSFLFAQEALKSTEEEYYDFLSLTGIVDYPVLAYRTLSDSVWSFNDDEHVWSNLYLGKVHTLWDNKNPSDNFFIKGMNQNIIFKVYGPEWFNSINTSSPLGDNDGALWQGRGYNTAFTTGIYAKAYGFSVVFKPQISFSQNAYFDIMPSAYSNPFGYFWGSGVDLPQRFGDKPLFTFDFGDTEVRYSWYTFTVGFGTENIWLGPAIQNPILHSNNAPSYPKFDIGLRRQRVVIPGLDWYLGDIEARLWVGYLSESDYFDYNPDNDHNMFTGLTFSYAPSFIKGLSIGANRVCIIPWTWSNLKYIFPNKENEYEDQKMSFYADWKFDAVGLDIYTEVGLDDYVPNGFPIGYIRYPLHTIAFTSGLKKSFDIKKDKNIYGLLRLEVNFSEMSQDFQFQWPYNWMMHHQLIQGYTNKGQLLGSGYGYGGNYQYLDFTVYYPKGNSTFLIARWNPDNNFNYSRAVGTGTYFQDLNSAYFMSFKAYFIIGLKTEFFITPSFKVNGTLIYNQIINPHYENTNAVIHNGHFEFGAKYYF